MEGLEVGSQPAVCGPRGIAGVDRRGRLGARIPHPVELALAAAATDGEIQAAVAAHGEVGERQGGA